MLWSFTRATKYATDRTNPFLHGERSQRVQGKKSIITTMIALHKAKQRRTYKRAASLVSRWGIGGTYASTRRRACEAEAGFAEVAAHSAVCVGIVAGVTTTTGAGLRREKLGRRRRGSRSTCAATDYVNRYQACVYLIAHACIDGCCVLTTHAFPASNVADEASEGRVDRPGCARARQEAGFAEVAAHSAVYAGTVARGVGCWKLVVLRGAYEKQAEARSMTCSD
eukprot:IDg22117t1